MTEDGSRYYGPYTSAWQSTNAGWLRRVFPYLTCDREITGQDSAPACTMTSSCALRLHQRHLQDGYRQMITDLMSFLKVTAKRSSRGFTMKWTEPPRAALRKGCPVRDQLKAIQSIIERQKVVFASDYKDSDVIAMARADGEACVQISLSAAGTDRASISSWKGRRTRGCEVMSGFVQQFYTEAAYVPEQLLLPQQIEEAQIIGQWSARGVAARKWNSSSQGRADAGAGPDGCGKCSRDPSSLRTHGRRHPQAGAGAGRAAIVLALSQPPTASSATTFPTCRAPRRSVPWCLHPGRSDKKLYGNSISTAPPLARRTISPAWKRS